LRIIISVFRLLKASNSILFIIYLKQKIAPYKGGYV